VVGHRRTVAALDPAVLLHLLVADTVLRGAVLAQALAAFLSHALYCHFGVNHLDIVHGRPPAQAALAWLCNVLNRAYCRTELSDPSSPASFRCMA